MKKLILMVATLCMVATAQAQNWGILAGVAGTQGKMDDPNVDSKVELNWRLGGTGMFDISENVLFRTGLTYTTRYTTFESNIGGGDGTLQFAYLDVPALFQFKVLSWMSLYVGPVASVIVHKKIENGPDAEGVKNLYVSGQAGANFMFGKFGLDLFYERGLGNAMGSWGNSQYPLEDVESFGTNFIYIF